MGISKSYEMPRFGSANDRIAGYLREAVSEGEAWLGAQRPASEYSAIIEAISPSDPSSDLLGQSNVSYNKTERIAREMVASLCSFSHIGEYKPESKQSLSPQADVLTKLDRHWFNLEQTYDAHRTLAQNAITLGTGYAWQTWDKHFHGDYKGDIRLTALGPDKVTFVQLPGDHDIQRAYVTLIREELPINLAKRIYARTNRSFAEALTPDRSSPGWISKGLRKVQEFLSPALRVRGTRPGEHDDASFPTVDIFHAYILDGTINESGSPMQMGALGTNWEYTVPSLGDPMPTALMNQATGQFFTRPADYADSLLFPFRRYAIFARSTDIVCYDGSSPWWHGLTPVVRLRFNDWPWEALGRSCVGMIRSMQASVTAIMAGTEDSIAARLDPPKLFNDSAVSKGFAESFNTRRGGVTAAADLSQGDVIKFPVPPQYYDIPSWIPEYMKWLDGRMDYLTGNTDLSAVAKAKQLPSGDSMEKLLEMAGPLVQDLVKAITQPYQQLGEMRKAYYLQFYTYERILQSTTSAGEPEDWLFQPNQLVAINPADDAKTRQTKARSLLSEFKYRVTQSGITEFNRMSTKLFYYQLMKLPNFPMDPWTYAKVAQIPQFGAIPENADTGEVCTTVIERWIAFQHLLRELQEELGGGQPPKQAGRPASGHASPQLQHKGGGTRSTVATSR